MSTAPLLAVEGLVKHFQLKRGFLRPGKAPILRAVDGVSFTLRAGETLALVGESGCGKTTVARAVAQLYRPNAGQIRFRGQDMMRLRRRGLRKERAGPAQKA